MKKKIFRNMDWGLVVCVIILLTISLLALYSATSSSDFDEFKKQIMWIGISIPVMIILLFIDYDVFAKISPIMYVVMLLILVAVLFTARVNGARSWFHIGSITIQPSEFAKVILIIVLSSFIAKKQQQGERGRDEISRPLVLLEILAIVAVPIGLILLEPDIGTASAFILATLSIIFVSGIKKRYIFIALILVAITLPLVYIYVLPEHAKTRIEVFLNPGIDPRGAGYNIIQSKLAVGSGEFLGMGLLKGNQTQLGFLYPKTTDFIFAVIGEEMGFVVGATIILTYVTLITRVIYIAKTSKDKLGSYIATGIAGIFIFHMTENIGMTMGLLPITGVPLPFVSYGGSSLLSNLIMIAVLLNISGRRQKAIFID